MPTSYDKNDAASVERFAQQLLNRSLADYFGGNVEQHYSGKGRLGQLLEDKFFGYRPNSASLPDFPEAMLELKTSPLKQTKKGLVSKERLVLNIIDYMREHELTFYTSSFYRKNAQLLLMFYLHEAEKLDYELIFKIIRRWEFPATDLAIIKHDWQTIVEKIRRGRAHEISEGDTLYLAACTKGANASSLRKQPFCDKLAMQRAFSLKSKYLNFIIQDSLNRATDSEPIVKNASQLMNQTFEQVVEGHFQPYLGMSEAEICATLRFPVPGGKAKGYQICRHILGVSKPLIQEFEKAEIELKTIKIENDGRIPEAMSFPQIKFKEIVRERWEESEWYDRLTRRFLLVVFIRASTGELYLHRVKFWNLPAQDLHQAMHVWVDTRAKIKRGDYQNFIKSSENPVAHVRPKGIDSRDLMETPQGTYEKKKCFWLNANYIRNLVSEL